MSSLGAAGVAVALHGVAEGAGEALVLLHPIGLDHSFWDDLPARLSRHRRVLLLDLRGHGDSPPGAVSEVLRAPARTDSKVPT